MPAYREQPPPAKLTHLVECVWTLQSPSALADHPIAPDGCLDLLYHRGHSLCVIGAMTVQQTFDISPGTELIGVRFKPGQAGTFLRASAAELTGGSVPLEDVWSHRAAQLQRQLDDQPSLHQCAQILLDFLPPLGVSPDAARKSIEALVASDGRMDLDAVARQANLSSRQFRRRCLEDSGLSPKLLSRILRFRRASKLAAAARSPVWAAIAADAGYFDQSHLIRDFRSLTGRTPMSVLSNTPTLRSHYSEADETHTGSDCRSHRDSAALLG